MTVYAEKTSLIRELFVRTADENYITARWCAINRLNVDFLWLSVHALEKYMKAVLLANDRPAKGYSHNVVKLYDEIKLFSADLLPNQLTKPVDLDIDHWRVRTPDQFMEHLHQNGNADNRYLIFGYVTFRQDLHMLDQMVFALRRLIVPLDDHIHVLGRVDRSELPTYRVQLKKQPDYFPRYFLPLDKIIDGAEDDPLRAVVLDQNMAFAPKNFEHSPPVYSSSSMNPVILRRILDPLKSTKQSDAAHGAMLARWLFDNIQVPKDVRIEIEKAISIAETVHGPL